MALPGANLQSSATMAYLMDMTGSRLRQLADAGVCTPVKRGTWDMVATLHAYIHYLRTGGKGEAAGPDVREERGRLLKAQADKAEIEAELLSQRVLAVDAVADYWGQVVSNVRARLLALPSRVAAQHGALVDYPSTEQVVRDLVEEALHELSAFQPDWERGQPLRPADAGGGVARLSSPAPVKPVRVGRRPSAA